MFRTGCGRIAVVNADRTIKTILTRTTGVSYIFDNLKCMGEAVTATTVADLKLRELTPACSISINARPLTAFKRMADEVRLHLCYFFM